MRNPGGDKLGEGVFSFILVFKALISEEVTKVFVKVKIGKQKVRTVWGMKQNFTHKHKKKKTDKQPLFFHHFNN